MDDLVNQHAHDPRGAPLETGRHGARVHPNNRDPIQNRISVQTALETVNHHDEEQLGRAVATEAAVPRGVFFRGAPFPSGDSFELVPGTDEGLVLFVAEGSDPGVPLVARTGDGALRQLVVPR